LARAKNTDRASARRRHREQLRAAQVDDFDGGLELDAGQDGAAATASPQVGGSLRGAFRIPDWREDARLLPGVLRHNKKLWIPFVALAVSFVLALALAQAVVSHAVIGGTIVSYEHGRILPVGLDSIVGMYVQLTLPPTALFVFFVGGFLAPRASYLIGALLGFIDGVLWSALFLLSPNAQPDAPGRVVAGDFAAILLVAVLVGTLAAGFAAWYRNFLRQSQDRARANRMAREQQARMKAKDDARKEREAQRQAAAAARQAKTSSR
jgi:hypothetical protein